MTMRIWITSAAVRKRGNGEFLHVIDERQILNPYDVMKTIGDYVSSSLGCETCQRHFAQLYETCKYGRCR